MNKQQVAEFVQRWVSLYLGKGWDHNEAIQELVKRAMMKYPDGEFNEVVISTNTQQAVVTELVKRIAENTVYTQDAITILGDNTRFVQVVKLVRIVYGLSLRDAKEACEKVRAYNNGFVTFKKVREMIDVAKEL